MAKAQPRIRISKPGRLAALSVLGLGLAVVTMAQSISWASLKSSPQAAVTAMPLNGVAQSRYAFTLFSQSIATPEDANNLSRNASAAASVAREAILAEPLTPKAQAILALAETDPVAQERLIDVFTALDRRDTALQGVILQAQVAREDYASTFATVDRLLRVNPELSEQFFPILLTALQEERGVSIMSELAEGNADWVVRFLRFAAAREDALPELTELSRRVQIDDRTFNGRLMASLYNSGQYETAYQVHENYVAMAADDPETDLDAKWKSGHPPFGWQLADRARFRAQPQKNGAGLSVSVNSGQNGVLATRVIRAPQTPFAVNITHSLAPASQLDNVRLQMRCGNESEPFLSQDLADGRTSFPVASLPQGCTFIRLTLRARVFSRESTLFGLIEDIEVVTG